MSRAPEDPEGLEARFEAFWGADVPRKLGVAVSGGGDSTALLVLLARLRSRVAFDLFCVTVDHGMRAASAQEAETVATLCAKLDVRHDILTWSGWNGAGNVQAAARTARYGLMADWAKSQSVTHVSLGHTRDDQAETVLMRLARGAGVDGLSAMAQRRDQGDVTWLRPLLSEDRATLRRWLRSAGFQWIEDPTNEDDRFARIRARQSWEALEPLGITPKALAQVAENMGLARAALVAQTREAAALGLRVSDGAVAIARPVLEAQPQEIKRRLFLGALAWVGGSVYAPRRRSVDAALAALVQDGAATLDGCHAVQDGQDLWVFREYNAVKDLRGPVAEIWDNRWRIEGPPNAGISHVGALGEAGIAALPDWRASGVPRQALLSTPAVWDGNDLVAAPAISGSAEWRAVLVNPAPVFL
jgi:tRNA(Ile)-lysidine synthase